MIGLPRVHHRTTDSTNARARELAAAGAPHGTTVTAEEQTAGRGRQGRTWLAEPGDALLMSVVVRELAPTLPLATAVAVAEACDALAPVQAQIKWPNDVWVDRRKICGILVEGRPQEGWAVLGVGINVRTREFPDELADIATSLARHGSEASVEDTLVELAQRLDRRLAAPADEILVSWAERDALRGERIRWAGGEGIAAGVDETGALVVELDGGGETKLDAGEVHLGRAAT
jgi:BirA family transcriptional regulator, biotin operon repressor / biotin---[acetyl-CoA-carboxylase] ligase